MASDPKEIKKIKDELNKLKAQLDQVTAKSLQDIMNKMSQGKASLTAWNTLLETFSIKADELADNLDYISKSLTENVNELIRGDEFINRQVTAQRKLRNISEELLGMRRGDSDYDLKKIKKLEEQAKKQQTVLRSQLEQLKAGSEEAKALEEQLETVGNLLGSFKGITKEANKFEKSMGITGGILKGMSKIPILGDLIGVQDALKAARDAAKDGAGRWGTLGAAMKSVGSNLTTSLTDPLFTIGLIVKAFKMLLELGFKVDTQQTALAKSFSLSYSSAKGLRDSFSAIQESTSKTMDYQERSLIHTTSLTDAAVQLGEAFDAGVLPTKSQLENQIMLTKQIGLSTEEANNLQQLAYQNNMTADDITKEVIQQTAAYRRQSGVQLNNKKILQDISKVSGQLRLQYANNPELIAKAVIQTQKLGMNLEQAKKAAEGLLNFEESIENELSAELLTGKDLNLERARLLALNGDSAAAVEEMARQMGTAANFSKMNVIQQESIAKAIGMSADELANSLIYREQLNKLGDDGKSQIEATIKALQEQGRTEEANNLQRDIANGVDAEKALKRVDQQTKFNESIEKLKLLLADIVDGPAQALASWLTTIVANAGALKAMFLGVATILGAIKLTGFISQLITALATSSALAATSAATASAITYGVGAIAIAAGIVTIMGALMSATSQAKQIKDGIINPKGGLIISGEKGTIQLDPQDSIIAGTNLFPKSMNDGAVNSKGKSIFSGAKGSIGVGADMSEVVAAINSLKSRPIVTQVYLDGKEISKGVSNNQSNYNADQMAISSNKIS